MPKRFLFLTAVVVVLGYLWVNTNVLSGAAGRVRGLIAERLDPLPPAGRWALLSVGGLLVLYMFTRRGRR